MTNQKHNILLLIIIGLLSGCNLQESQIPLIDGGNSNHSIVIPEVADEFYIKAAKELQFYIKEISGTVLEIVTYQENNLPEFGIYLGSYFKYTSYDELGEDGFIIKTDHDNVYISGNTGISILYGTYTFLEDYLGVKKYTPEFTYIPRSESINIPKINRTDIPFFSFRQVHIINGYDPDYALWHKLHPKEVRDADWGMYVHTFDDFIPPDQYFNTNPEYFSLIGGTRVPDAQLCLSNKEVYDIIVSDLTARIKENPEAKYWSVSQNDTYYPCQCDDCRKLDKEYGGPSGTMLWFINMIAREFPEKNISMLAYQYTRNAPKNIVPEKNANIMLCTIECNRSKPIASNSGEGSFTNDIIDWGSLTNNIYLWDYVVQFRNYADPFPNLRVLQPNIQFFRDNNVKMMFQQGSGGSTSEFHNLRSYIIAKLLWNPDVDVEKIINDFVANYYGPAAPYILKYINTMHNALDSSNGGLGIYGYPWDGVNTYLTPELMDRYTELFNEAEKAVNGDTAYYDRYRFARVPLEFAILEISRRNITPKYSTFIKKDGNWTVNKEMKERLDLFVDWANDLGFERLEEHGHPTPDEYYDEMQQYFNFGRVTHLASGKNVIMANPPSEKYDVGGAAALTDEKRGTIDWHINYTGFEGENMDAVIDLEEIMQVSSIEVNFVQDHVYWIFAPEKVEFYSSIDGVNYEFLDSDLLETDEKIRNFIETYSCYFSPRSAKYIKVVTKTRLTCPEWHKGVGGNSWIFTDEIVVN